MADFDISIEGLDVLAQSQSAGDNYRRRVQAAIVAEAEAIMADAKEHYVPVDTGALRASGHVVLPVGDELMVTMAFGGPAASYAPIVHEDPTAHHPVGQWKYLETPALAATHGLADRIKARIQE